MRLVTFLPAGGTTARLGAIVGDAVVDLALARSGVPATMAELLALGPQGLALARAALEEGSRAGGSAARHALAAVRLLAPLPRPGKILGVGRNYGAHAAEGGLTTQEKPRIFVKLSSTVIGTGTPIRKPSAVRKLDYETELAVVIGTAGHDIPERDALAHVAGYSILNDVSARELQFDVSPPQTSFAKSMDGFCPMGPCLATPDEFADAADIELSCSVNGAEVQRATTKDMIFPVPALIAYLSRYVTLEPGDVIATGTPAGVGAFRKPPRYLEPGDVVRMEIPGIGVLENAIV
ncbi:MAG TPA: fumarylacetoacetate hydrolase family protein [Alphaproteobacteria bacterium]|nr:fumarylacetoacetate hydrolase family protein [Alphaproteobacteria bacterium]